MKVRGSIPVDDLVNDYLQRKGSITGKSVTIVKQEMSNFFI